MPERNLVITDKPTVRYISYIGQFVLLTFLLLLSDSWNLIEENMW